MKQIMNAVVYSRKETNATRIMLKTYSKQFVIFTNGLTVCRLQISTREKSQQVALTNAG